MLARGVYLRRELSALLPFPFLGTRSHCDLECTCGEWRKQSWRSSASDSILVRYRSCARSKCRCQVNISPADGCRTEAVLRGLRSRVRGRLHYNWKYIFVRPTVEEVCARYRAKHGQGNGVREASAPPPTVEPSPATEDDAGSM